MNSKNPEVWLSQSWFWRRILSIDQWIKDLSDLASATYVDNDVICRLWRHNSINHNILISRLSSCFGLTVWLLTGFPHTCTTDDSLLRLVMPALPSLTTSGVPQGSVLGPIPFCSLHLAYLGHRGCSWCPAATICRWHPTLHLCICQNYST